MPIKVADFSEEKSVTYKYMFHELVFSWEPTFRFKTDELLKLGFLMSSHRSQKHARDHLWGLMNPYVKANLSRDEVKEFMGSLVKLATILPWEYYQSLETKRDMNVFQFLETCEDQGRALVMNKTF